jgi:beta-hydroxyacyl-ACP dehydratase FabZ
MTANSEKIPSEALLTPTSSGVINAPAVEQVIFDINQIKEIIPHRYPFLLIDKIVEFEDNVRIVGIKSVTFNEWYFPGHFPEKPVMPGVLILEAMAQTGAIFAMRSTDGVDPTKIMYLVGATDVKWKKQVLPGDTLRIEMKTVKKRRPLWILEGRAYVQGKVVAQATISAAEA